MSVLEEGDVKEDTHLLERKGKQDEKTKKVCVYVYISHFLSAWGDRMWQFGVGLFLVIISPDSLLLTAVYGFAMGAAVLFFGPLVGDWVDKTARLSAARISLIIQNLSIAACAALLYIVIVYKSEIEATWHNSGLLYLSYCVIILVAILAQLASTGNTIAVEKDWIVEICRGDNDLLASTNAVLKSIDLITQIAAPIATGQIMAFGSTEIGALYIGGWNLVSVFVEYWLLWKVYKVVPALQAAKDNRKVGQAAEPQGPCGCVRSMFNSVLILVRGWRTFLAYDVAYAGLGLAALYMTVLGFDNITVGFAYTQGVNESIMGALMAAGALFGILGTILFPRMRKCIGLQRTGLFGLFFETSCLTLCVASVWAPGSPFNINFKKKTELKTNFTINRTFENVSSGLSPSTEIKQVTNVATTVYPYLTMNTTYSCCINDPHVTGDEDWRNYISVGLLMAGIVGARCGLWMTDLTVSQLFLEGVVESERGIVLGVQTALNQLMDMLKFAMVIVVPEPEVFGMLVIVSFVFVCIGWALYAKYSRKARGHLFHFNKVFPSHCYVSQKAKTRDHGLYMKLEGGVDDVAT